MRFQIDAGSANQKEALKANEKASSQFENGPYYILQLFLTIYLQFFLSSHKQIYQLQLKIGCAH